MRSRHGKVGQADDWSHVLVKPDGVQLGMTALVVERLAAANLLVEEVGELRLSAEDARRWYPEKCDEPDGPLTLAYLSEGPMTLLAVSGPDAIGTAYQVKRSIRAGFASDDRRNLVHCPETVGERDHERAVFAPLLAGRSS